MGKWLSKHWDQLAGALMGVTLTACSTACSTAGTVPWTDAQTAYVELVSYQAAQSATIAVIQQPGLSPRDVADIKGAEATATGAITAQAEILAGAGDIQGQAVATLTGTMVSAASSLEAVVTAKHGATTASTTQIAEAGGLAVLADAPAVIAAIDKVRSGWTPNGVDIANAVAEVQALHTQAQGLGVTSSQGL